MAAWIKKLQESGRYADLYIRAEANIVFAAHRAVVCGQSEIIAQQVNSLPPDEGKILELDLTNEGRLVVQELLIWMYTSEYSDREGVKFCSQPTHLHHNALYDREPSNKIAILRPAGPARKEDGLKARSTRSLILNMQMFIAAIRYEIPELKLLAARKYKDAMCYFWDSGEFVISAKLLWDEIPGIEESLKEAIAEVAFKNLEKLVKYEEFGAMMPMEGSLGSLMMRIGSRSAKDKIEDIRRRIGAEWDYGVRAEENKKRHIHPMTWSEALDALSFFAGYSLGRLVLPFKLLRRGKKSQR